MGFLSVVKRIQREKCQRLIQTNARTISFSASERLHFAIGKTRHSSIELKQPSELAVFMDTIQYEMCVHLSSLPKNHPSYSVYAKKRLQIILALTQLRAVLISQNDEETLALQETLTKFILSLISEESELFSRVFKLIPPSLLYRSLNEKEIRNKLEIT